MRGMRHPSALALVLLLTAAAAAAAVQSDAPEHDEVPAPHILLLRPRPAARVSAQGVYRAANTAAAAANAAGDAAAAAATDIAAEDDAADDAIVDDVLEAVGACLSGYKPSLLARSRVLRLAVRGAVLWFSESDTALLRSNASCADAIVDVERDAVVTAQGFRSGPRKTVHVPFIFSGPSSMPEVSAQGEALAVQAHWGLDRVDQQRQGRQYANSLSEYSFSLKPLGLTPQGCLR